MPALDASSLRWSLLQLAQELGAGSAEVDAALTGRRDPADLLWRHLGTRTGWLLVIDNADDISVLECGGRPVRDGNGWLRPTTAGLIITTSRVSDPRNWGRNTQIHPIGWLSNQDGARVLLDLAPHAGSRTTAQILSERLGGLALALHQAGSHLASPFAREATFEGYARALESRFAELLGAGGRDRDVVTGTWELSLDQLAQNDVPQARDLLRVLAWFMGALPIPVWLLDHEVLAGICGDASAEKAGVGLEALRSVGLIETRSARRSDTIAVVHPLVAEAVRLQQSTGENPWRETAATLLRRALPEDPVLSQNWAIYSTLLPHARIVFAEDPDELGKFVRYLEASGGYEAARALQRQICECLESEHGRNDAASLLARAVLADLTGQAGEVTEALHQLIELVPASEEALGPEHPHTLVARASLAQWTGEAGDAVSARDQYAEIVPIREMVLGAEHDETLISRANLAYCTGLAGDPAEARDQFARLVRIRERVSGPEHLHTLVDGLNLARWTGESGDPTAARDQFSDLLPLHERLLGAEHPRTLITRANLARWTGEAGDPAAARDQYADLLPVRRRVLGPEHPHVLSSTANLARWTGEAGDPTAAYEQYLRLLPLYERVLGADHPRTMEVRSSLTRWSDISGYGREDWGASVSREFIDREHPL
ncbi:tetratricopeptide repeat protein [Actinomadura sp. K4S16]|uniref:tetratricopeptide repeat protein n=1 Tax=Actinomadura sp. K4S16 TaxID=1316147 RepID=UPI00135917E6|nr:tetratricopeptide repeat protein [Actinomadura sp. K4S16]